MIYQNSDIKLKWFLTGERGYDREIKQNIQTQYQNSEISPQ